MIQEERPADLIMPGQRGSMKTGSKLDKLEELIPTEIPAGHPGPMRRQPMQCCANCRHLSKKTGDRYECHPPGSWFIKEIKGGEISVNMPNTYLCFTPTTDAYSEFANDPWNATAEGIQQYLNGLERVIKDLEKKGLGDDWTTDDHASKVI